MVLMILLLINGFAHQTDILEQYNKQVHKTISKVYQQDHDKLQLIKDGYYQIVGEENTIGYLLLSEVAACHLGGCTSFAQKEILTQNSKSSAQQGSEYFDVLVLLDHNKTILKVKILNYFSDYGYEVTSKKYLEKFKGKSVCDFNSSTDGVDAISGATISSMALEGFLGFHCID